MVVRFAYIHKFQELEEQMILAQEERELLVKQSQMQREVEAAELAKAADLAKAKLAQSDEQRIEHLQVRDFSPLHRRRHCRHRHRRIRWTLALAARRPPRLPSPPLPSPPAHYPLVTLSPCAHHPPLPPFPTPCPSVYP